MATATATQTIPTAATAAAAATNGITNGQHFTSRRVVQKLLSVEQAEGMGARVRRSIGRPELRNFDPFLMLDEFKAGDNAGGFPDHPHAGMSTVTFVLPSSKGSFQHEDFTGRAGEISAGDVQWMNAGKGIVHSEMPVEGSGMVHGLQLWVNLAKKDKKSDPDYQEIKAKDIPHAEKDGVKVRVIAGESLGAKSKVFTTQPTTYFYFEMQPHSRLEQPIDERFNSFVYTIGGSAIYGGSKAEAHHTLALSRDGTGLTVETVDSPAEFVLISGLPTGETVAQMGPFVQCTQGEIRQTYENYHLGRNGFERAPGWHSKIGERILGKHDEL